MATNVLNNDERTTLPFKNKVMDQVETCLKASHPEDLDKVAATPVVSLKFEDILGAKEDPKHWWLLYINPKDWIGADKWAKEKGKDPGLCYDEAFSGLESKMHQRDSIAAYKKYLVGTFSQHQKGREPINWEFYCDIWKATSEEAIDRNPTKWIPKSELKNMDGNFPCTEQVASDVLTEKVLEYDLVVDYGGGKEPKPVNACAWHWTSTMMNRALWPQLYGKELLPRLTNEVFKSFDEEIEKAKTPRAQLTAIARLIRRLQIFHAFKDGNKRTNVCLILPAMLLRYGFGLTLGGEHGRSIDRRAVDMMFQGGFSLEEIVNFLWVMQDFGLKSVKAGKGTVLAGLQQ